MADEFTKYEDIGVDFYQKVGDKAMAGAVDQGQYELERLRQSVNAIPSSYEKDPTIEVIPGAPQQVQTILKGFSPIQMFKSVTNDIIDLMEFGRGKKEMKPEEVVLAGTSVAVPGFVAGKVAYPIESLGVFGSRLSPMSRKAQQLNRDLQRVEQKAELSELTPTEVLKETGLSKDFNGNWVIEVDDSQAKLPVISFEMYKEVQKGNAKLPDVLNHPELYEVFPYLRDINVRDYKEPGGQYHRDSNVIEYDITATPDEKLKTLLHEAQHAVNTHEVKAGTLRSLGETTGDVLENRIADFDATIAQAADRGVISDEQADQLIGILGHMRQPDDFYTINPGEVEARNVEARMHLGELARREVLPERTEDIPRELQLDLSEYRSDKMPNPKSVPAKPFYSAVENAVEATPTAMAPASDWLGMIRNAKGVKGEEIEWLGLEEFMASGQKLSKDEVLDYVRNNRVEVTEVSKTRSKENLVWNKQEDGSFTDQDGSITIARLANGTWSVKAKGEHPADERIAGTFEEAKIKAQSIFDTRISISATRESNDARWSEWTTPGGENYRELLFTLPRERLGKEVWDEGRNRSENQFQSAHWDEPNVLAHVRMKDREIGGEKTIVIEEVQSDWHQQGRERGYLKPLTKEEELEYETLGRELMTIDKQGDPEGTAAIRRRLGELSERRYQDPDREPKVADAPFKKTWPALVLKRIVTEAARRGDSQVAWLSGESRADLFGLEKRVSSISYDPLSGQLLAWPLDTNLNPGPIINEAGVRPEKLADYIGKELADKIVNNPTKRQRIRFNNEDKEYNVLFNVDLKIGGEGMKGFYNEILPAKAKKLFGKYGAKIEEKEIAAPGTLVLERQEADGSYVFRSKIDGQAYNGFGKTPEQAEKDLIKWLETTGGFDDNTFKPSAKHKVFVMTIPPELRTAANEGFPLFASGAPLPTFGEEDE